MTRRQVSFPTWILRPAIRLRKATRRRKAMRPRRFRRFPPICPSMNHPAWDGSDRIGRRNALMLRPINTSDATP